MGGITVIKQHLEDTSMGTSLRVTSIKSTHKSDPFKQVVKLHITGLC